MRSQSPEQQIREHYQALYAAFGPLHWWPARTRFEVIVGAYLTQNTSWNNAELALLRLRRARALTLMAIRNMPTSDLETLIRPAGYFRQKAARLKLFVDFVDLRYTGSLTRMFSEPTAKLRAELLELPGVGPETADSILLYAGQHEVFVVDAYTRRILVRHGIISVKADYEEIRALCEQSLTGLVRLSPAANPKNCQRISSSTGHKPSSMSLCARSPRAQTYNDMHGLIVAVGKHYCLKSHPQCEGCPLQIFLP